MKTARSKLLLAMAGGAAVVYAAIGVPTSTGAGIYTSAGHAASAKTAASVAPNPTNSLDCNGYSQSYKPVKPGLKALCVDPKAVGHSYYSARNGRFYDNGHYVGHDEPAVKFESSAAGSGNHMTYFMQLPTDPSGQPTTSPTGTTTSNQAELTPAFWFGLPLCDSNSWPTASGSSQGLGGSHPCTPNSDANAPSQSNPTGSGSAAMELQFYPPGYGPSFDAISCDPTKYCASLNIDSFENICNVNDPNICSANPNCAEPVNYAFLTLDGAPTGPPSPQLNAYSTFSANSNTLKMGQGDSIRTTIFDTAHGIETKIDDLTTGQSGFMIASASNGFMNTNPSDCSGTPYDFHAEYNTAAQGNLVPWTALEFGVLVSNELGHFEPCSSISNTLPYTATFSPSVDVFHDNSAAQTCTGTFEAQNGGGTTGETCSASGSSCTGNTQGQLGCSPTATNHCEGSDYPCFAAGSRTVTVNGVNQTWSWPVNGCLAAYFQNGDLDFDGSSYIPDWADGANTHPTSFRFLGPFDASGSPYPTTQFETNLPGAEQNCNFQVPSSCTVPPAGSAFYPFWSLESTQAVSGVSPTVANACIWNFGNTITGVTTNSFGGSTQYGSASNFFPGTRISSPVANPAVNTPCPTLNENQTAPAPPVIGPATISPTYGLYSVSTKVTVAGSNFSGTFGINAYTVQSVHVGTTGVSTVCSTPANPTVKPCFTVDTPTQLTVWVPTASPGTVDITATNPGGTSVTSAADLFTYLPFTQLYMLDAYGALHSIPASGSLSALFTFKIARAVVLLANGTGGYVLDGWGGIHPFGTAQGVNGAAYWGGWDIARGIVLVPNGSGGATGGYVLDGWGGMHPFGIGASPPPPQITVQPSWRGWDIARGVVINSAGTGGYILDGWGGIHPYAAMNAAVPADITVRGFWSGWDIARGITLGADNASGYTLDGWGGIHPYGTGSNQPPAPQTYGYWLGWDIARSIVVQPGQVSQGWTLDGWGGVHAFGNAAQVDTGASTPGRDINRALAVH